MPPNAGIDERAIVHPDARIGRDVTIGPYCVIGPGVKVGDRCRLEPHSIVHRDTEIGEENRIGPAASIGGDPQDLKDGSEQTRLIIGPRNRIHEYGKADSGKPGSAKRRDYNRRWLENDGKSIKRKTCPDGAGGSKPCAKK